MSKELETLLEAARKHTPTQKEREEQRRSFAYGNTNIENQIITRQTVDRQAESLKAEADESRKAKAQ